jgi:hypothetical protein
MDGNLGVDLFSYLSDNQKGPARSGPFWLRDDD